MTVERFESLLDAYGGDFRRWPESRVTAARKLLAVSPEARLRLAEAQALDRLLDRETTVDPRRLAVLTDRIVSSATEEARGAPRAAMGRIIQLPTAAGRSGYPPSASPARQGSSPVGSNSPWRAVAALAASLFLGVAIGLTDLGMTTTDGFASYVRPTASEAEAVISAVQLDNLNVLDEDQI